MREDRENCRCRFLVLVLVQFIYKVIRVGMYVTLNGLMVAFSSCSPLRVGGAPELSAGVGMN